MTNLFRVAIAPSLLLVLLCYGCASRPDDKITAATDAKNQAIEQRAEQYAPEEWKSAEEIWNKAQGELNKESWSAAGASLETARARYIKARDVAKDDRESVLTTVRGIQSDIDGSYSAFKAAGSKLTGANKKDFTAACADIDKRIAIVKSLLEQGGYLEAKTAGQETLQAISFHQKKLLGK